jgi:hypothetical protein
MEMVAAAFVASEDGLVAARLLSVSQHTRPKHGPRTPLWSFVGATAFPTDRDPDEGAFGDAEIIERYGETPKDLSLL